ncbi:DUF11 domain-containing protein, partial [Patescibacteria group bacterium]|nr:DUF11 domain-containing protein [Patescibacteria group bacterium]
SLIITDTIPAELFYIETVSITHIDSIGWSSSVTTTDSPAQAATGLLSWTLENTLDLAPGETITLVFNVGSRCNFAGDTNYVSFTTHTCFGDTYSLPAAGLHTASVSDTPGMSNISVEKTPATFDAEGPNTWTITLTNTGTVATDRNIVTDTLPSYVTSYSASPTWTSEQVIGGDTVLTWVINTPIASGGGTFDINFSGTISCIHTDEANTVSVVTGCANLFDSMALDCVVNSDSDTSTPYWVLKSTDINIAETLPSAIQVCTIDGIDSNTFEIVFTNLSPAEPSNESLTGYAPTIITDTLPTGLTYISTSTQITWTGEVDWTTDPDTIGTGADGDTQILVWTLPYDFEPQDTISLTFRVENPSSLGCGDFSEPQQNEITIRMHPCDGSDTYGFDDISTDTITKLDPNLSITKSVVDANTTTHDPTNAWLVPGDTVIYTITVTNSGDGKARNLIIGDTLSNYLHYDTESHSASDTFDGHTGGYNGGYCQWTINEIASGGGTASVTLYATVLHDLYNDSPSQTDMPDGTIITNEADSLTVTEICCDETDTGNSLTIDVEAPYVWVEKHLINPSTGTPSVGDEITFRIDYGNDTGSSTAYDIVITDTMPAGLVYISGGTYDSGTGVITFANEFILHGSVGNPGWLDPGETASVYFRAKINSSPAGGINNVAVLDHKDDNGYPRDQISDTETFQVYVLDLEKSAPATASPGEEITFTLTIVNDSTDPVNDLNLTDTLPGWVSFVTASDGGTYDTSAHTVNWLIGSILQQSSRVITVDVLVQDSTPDQTVLNNQAILVHDTDTVVASSNTTVQRPILYVDKNASCFPGTGCNLQPGDTLSYTIRYENTGSGIARIVITDTLPAEVIYIEDNSSYSDTNVGQAYTWPDVSSETYSVAGFTVGYFTVTVRLTDTVSLNQLFTNEVSLSYWDKTSGTFYNTLYDSLSLITSQSLAAGPIQIQKVSSTPVVTAGDPVSYILTVTNTGSSDLDNIVVTDTFPSTITYDTSYPSVPAPTNGPGNGDTVLIWSFSASGDLPDTLHPGESRQIQVTGVAASDTSGQFINQAKVTAEDINDSAVTESDTTSVVIEEPYAGIQVSKVANHAYIEADGQESYHITVTNIGNEVLDNIDLY